MSKGQNIVEQAVDSMIDVKDAAKDKVKKAKDEIKRSLGGVADEINETSRDSEQMREFGQETFEKSGEELRNAELKDKNENSRDELEGKREGAKSRFRAPSESDMEDGSILRTSRFNYDLEPPMAAQRVTTMLLNNMEMFETVNSSRAIPAICYNLRKILR